MADQKSPEFLRSLARKEAHLREARNNINCFIEYCMTDAHGKPITQGEIHREWHELGDRYRRLMILGSKQHGKCLAAGSRVLAADGSMVPIEEWDGRDLIALDLDRWEFTRASSSPVIESGTKPVYEIKTITGRTLKASTNHPFLTITGWSELGNLIEGDFIAIPRGVECLDSSGDITDDEAFLLGYLTGDGGVKSRVTFTNADPDILAHVCAIVTRMGWTFKKSTGKYGWYIGWKKGVKLGGPTDWARQHGILGRGSGTKVVPDSIWSASPMAVLCFIAGYFATDGTVNPKRRGAASIVSKSKDLLCGVQLLLQRFGVVTTLREKRVKYRESRRSHWRMFARGRDLKRLATLLPLVGEKGDRLRRVGALVEPGPSRLHRVPNEWKQLLRSSQKEIARRGQCVKGSRPMSRDKVRRAAALDDRNQELMRVVNAPISWDQIESIEHIGEEPVYDLSVPAHHNFIAEGFIVHNSQQALWRAMFKLGRDRNELIKIVCSSDRKGSKRMQTIRRNIEGNDLMHLVFPHLAPRGVRAINKKHLYLERPTDSPEPSVEAIGITSSATGDRATGLIVDDAVDQRNSVMQPKMRESIRNAWGDWYSLLSPDGWMYWISNLWHKSDLTHELMANEAYAVARYEVDLDTMEGIVTLPDGTVRRMPDGLWPEYWSARKLRDQKRTLKPRAFARLYSLRPMSTSEVRVHRDWIRPWKSPPEDDWDRIMFLDLAESEESGADMIGIAEAMVSPTSPKIKIVDAWHTKIDFDAKVQLLREQHREHHYSDIVLEKSAGGISLFQHLVRRYRLPIRLLPVAGKRKSLWLDEAIPYLKGKVVEWDPWLIENSGEMGDRGDGVAEILNFGSYPTDNILDAITRIISYITTCYEIFDDVDLDGDIEDGDDVLSSKAYDNDDFEVVLI